MSLVPEAVQFLESQKGGGLVSSVVASIDDARSQIPLLPGPPEPVAEVFDEQIPGPDGPLTLRCYRSAAATTGSPLILFFHGGGWVLGSLDTHDPLARRICNAAGATVLSVDYRLAPEHPFPAAPEDCYAALQWAAANAPRFDTDASRIAVTGDSAGGNLAAVVCLMARDRGGTMPAHQGLIYPITDCDLDTNSYLEHAEGKSLTRKMMKWFWDQYARPRNIGSTRSHHRCGPRTCPGCLRRGSWSPITIPCTTRESPSSIACNRPACRSSTSGLRD